MKMKICKGCGKTFESSTIIDGKRRSLFCRRFCLTCSPFNEFSKVHNKKPIIDGKRECKTCKKLVPVKEFLLKSGLFRPTCIKCTTSQSTMWWREHPEQQILSSARARAKQKNLPINITKEDIIIPEYCPVLGIKLEKKIGIGASDNSPTLDRLIPEKGYVKGNVFVISHRANAIKNCGTIEEHLKIAEYIRSKLN